MLALFDQLQQEVSTHETLRALCVEVTAGTREKWRLQDGLITVADKIYVLGTSPFLPVVLEAAHGVSHEGVAKTLQRLCLNFHVPGATSRSSSTRPTYYNLSTCRPSCGRRGHGLRGRLPPHQRQFSHLDLRRQVLQVRALHTHGAPIHRHNRREGLLRYHCPLARNPLLRCLQSGSGVL
jgi:hypothetical protein